MVVRPRSNGHPTQVGRIFDPGRMDLGTGIATESIVKIQLTRTKTIEIGFGGKKKGPARSKVDMTGVELCSGESQGAPAVRIMRRKSGWQIVAARFIPPPNGELPQRWEDTPHQPV